MLGSSAQRVDPASEIGGRRHGLTAGYRQGHVAIGEIAKTMRREKFARNALEGSHDGHVAHRSAAQLQRQSGALLDRKRLCSKGLAHDAASNAAASDVTVGWSVKSSFIGVIEIWFCSSASRSVPAPGVKLPR